MNHLLVKSRYFLLSLLIPIASSFSDSLSSIPALKFDGMKGKVLVVKDSTYKVREHTNGVKPEDLLSVAILIYDEDGNKEKETIYDNRETVIYKETDIYENGMLSKMKSETQWGKSQSRLIERRKNYEKWEYVDEEGETSIENIIGGLTIISKNDYGDTLLVKSFDKSGHLLEIEVHDAGVISARSLYEYGKDGNLLKESDYHLSFEDPETREYKYVEFDKAGNWTMRYESLNGALTSVRKRLITYR